MAVACELLLGQAVLRVLLDLPTKHLAGAISVYVQRDDAATGMDGSGTGIVESFSTNGMFDPAARRR